MLLDSDPSMVLEDEWNDLLSPAVWHKKNKLQNEDLHDKEAPCNTWKCTQSVHLVTPFKGQLDLGSKIRKIILFNILNFQLDNMHMRALQKKSIPILKTLHRSKCLHMKDFIKFKFTFVMTLTYSLDNLMSCKIICHIIFI